MTLIIKKAKNKKEIFFLRIKRSEWYTGSDYRICSRKKKSCFLHLAEASSFSEKWNVPALKKNGMDPLAIIDSFFAADETIPPIFCKFFNINKKTKNVDLNAVGEKIWGTEGDPDFTEADREEIIRKLFLKKGVEIEFVDDFGKIETCPVCSKTQLWSKGACPDCCPAVYESRK